jgi:DNA-3-methyladenine glycosylase
MQKTCLPRWFYARDTLDVARDLIGKVLVRVGPEGRVAGRVVEVEAYIGQDDPACHAARGRTARNAVMFGPPGFSYVYFIYGMYFCLNVVTEREGFAAAVLIRAAEPTEGESIMRRRSPKLQPARLLSGPGRLCRSMAITREHNGLDLRGDALYFEDHSAGPSRVVQTPRIGIRQGRRRLWRFCDPDSKALSRPVSTISKTGE